MARYIDADKIHQFVEDNFKGDVPYEWAWTLTAIDKEPTADVVPVVRCKDCKYYKAQKQSVNWKNKKKYCCRVVALKVNENDYCSYGERKCE